jgi:hypothetical protein
MHACDTTELKTNFLSDVPEGTTQDHFISSWLHQSVNNIVQKKKIVYMYYKEVKQAS